MPLIGPTKRCITPNDTDNSVLAFLRTDAHGAAILCVVNFTPVFHPIYRIGLPLGDARMIGHACMLNWIGAMPDAGALLREAGGHWHDYGKSPREGRKVGHATLRADSKEELAAALQRVGDALGRQAQVAPVVARLQSR